MGNLNFNTTPEQLSEFLAPAGEIVDIYFATDRETGRPRGFAFVTFAEDSHATAAIQKFNGSELDGRALNINEAKERPRRPSGPRPGGPRPSGPRPSGPRPGGPGGERRPPFQDSSFRGGGGVRSEGAFTGPDGEAYDPTVEKGFDDRDHENEYEDGGGGGGGRNQGRKPKKTRKGSRRGLRARKRSL